MTTAARRLPLTGAAVLLATIGVIAVAQAPAFEPTFAVLFVLTAWARLSLGRHTGRMLPLVALRALGCSVAAASLAYVLHRLSTGGAVDGPNALWALMEVTCLFEALALLWRQRAFSSFLVILFSSVHATGIAFAVPGRAGLILVGVYLAALVWTLLVFERAAALERDETPDTGVRRVRAGDLSALPLGAAVRTTLVLLVLGLPLGGLLYLAAPRNFELPGHLGPRGDLEVVGTDSADAAEDENGAAPGAAPTTFASTGPGGSAPLGSVAEIKRNIEPFYEVALLEGTGLPPTVILRENVQDEYDVRGVWRDTLAAESRPHVYRDGDDFRPDGWIPLAHAGASGQRVTLRIELLKGGNRRLFLQPNAMAVQIRRDGRILAPAQVVGTDDEALAAPIPFRAGDVVVQRYMPPLSEDRDLVGRRSDSAVSPQTSYLQVPPDVLHPLERRARAVVGAETDPWRRARRLDSWLRSEDFTYTLKMAPLDRRNPLVDFVERTREGHCEPFAFALTLMLRSLGHPARYVRGFWGGDELEERGTVILRGSHYHAWTEMYLDGAGWIALNPTPPDRRAADAGSITGVREAPGEARTEDFAFDFLGFDEVEWRGFWAWIGGGLRAWVLDPIALLFTARWCWLGYYLLALLLVGLRRRGTS
ncbi:MAG: transglutaminase-like domain-containing protein, partial [Planctomycetota bacterium]|nr:transglutaminase-like domain-containing protein [Planctomycetota bacterium]